MGRVRVQFPWQEDKNQKTPWIRLTQLFSRHRQFGIHLDEEGYYRIFTRVIDRIWTSDETKYDIATSLRRKIVHQSIKIYNEIRPHFSNHYLTPNQMHKHSQLKMKTYKTKNQNKNVLLWFN